MRERLSEYSWHERWKYVFCACARTSGAELREVINALLFVALPDGIESPLLSRDPLF